MEKIRKQHWSLVGMTVSQIICDNTPWENVKKAEIVEITTAGAFLRVTKVRTDGKMEEGAIIFLSNGSYQLIIGPQENK